jgi:hypothetical protein
VLARRAPRAFASGEEVDSISGTDELTRQVILAGLFLVLFLVVFAGGQFQEILRALGW